MSASGENSLSSYNIKEVRLRRIHGYRNLRVSRPVLFGEAREFVWERSLRIFGERSFGFAELNVSAGAKERVGQTPADVTIAGNPMFRLYAFLYGTVLTQKEKQRLWQTPKDFFAKAGIRFRKSVKLPLQNPQVGRVSAVDAFGGSA